MLDNVALITVVIANRAKKKLKWQEKISHCKHAVGGILKELRIFHRLKVNIFIKGILCDLFQGDALNPQKNLEADFFADLLS